MELRQLRYFVKTAETLNFSEAARQLYITQSTLSQQIRQLEEELGVELFQRDSHSVSLTESGVHLLPNAKRTLQDAEDCFTQIRDLGQILTGELNIGVTYSFTHIVSEAAKTFIRKYPGVKLNIISRNMEVLLDLLKHREVDFVLCFRPSSIDSEIESHVLFEDRLCAIMRKDHPLADHESISLEDLMNQRIALPGKTTQARNAFNLNFPDAGSRLNVQVEINSVSFLIDLVRTANMITVLSESVLDFAEEADKLKAIPLNAPYTVLEGCVHTLKKVYRKRSADAFMRILCESDAVAERARNWLK